MPRRHALLAAVLAVALGGAALWLAARPEPPSDEEQVRALVDAAARAAEERRPAGAVAGVSERFRGQDGLDRDGLRRMVAALTLRGAWVGVKPAGVRVTVRGDQAVAVVDLVLARGGAGKALADLLPAEASAYRVDCRLAREAEGWRAVEAAWRPVPLGEALAGDPSPRPRERRRVTAPRRSARIRRSA